MNRKTTGWVATAALCALVMPASGSTVLLTDDFEADVVGEGKTSLNQWTVTRGNVDVVVADLVSMIGPTGRAIVLDLDGGGPVAGRLESKQTFNLTPGVYRLTFDVSGSLRNYPLFPEVDTMTVSLGSAFSTQITKRWDEPFEFKAYDITVTSPTSAKLAFDHAGGDRMGLMLDNVTLASPAAGPVPIPLPAAGWAGGLTLAGLAMAGRVRRRV